MKTSIILRSIAVFAIMILAAEISFSGIHDPKETSALKQFMTKNVPYPAFAKENYQEGYVVIAFNVENDGKITIKDINGSTPEFKEYVENKLKELIMEDPQMYQGELHYYRFDFKLINDY
jgi:hypothetical protein